VNIYVDVGDWTCNYNMNKGKYEQIQAIKEQNAEHGTKYVYLDIPEPEKIKFISDLNNISKSYISDNEYYMMMYYYIYKLFEKYGNKRHITNLKKSTDYKNVIGSHKRIMESIAKKHKKNMGKTTQRKRNVEIGRTKFKI